MSIKHRKHTTNVGVQKINSALMDDTVVTMESVTILMGGPSSPDISKPRIKIKKPRIK